jgi:hypothetical protein
MSEGYFPRRILSVQKVTQEQKIGNNRQYFSVNAAPLIPVAPAVEATPVRGWAGVASAISSAAFHCGLALLAFQNTDHRSSRRPLKKWMAHRSC